MTTRPHDHRSFPAVTCWFCARRLTVAEIERDGIIRSRRQKLGGPYRLLVCPQCGRENICERSRRGRWFASPNMRVSIFEYFFSQLLDTRPEDFLAAASWFKENEARRRYFFERDGDTRYSEGWFDRIWPQMPEPASGERIEPGRPSPQADRSGEKVGGKTTSNRTASEEATGGETNRTTERERPRKPGHLLSPHEILQISAMASAAEIRSAFRRLARQCHPDKVYHLGEEAQRLAHDKFTRLKAAYEVLLERRENEE